MYAAQFELEHGVVSVCAGGVRPGTPGVIPSALLSALAERRLVNLAVRCRFSSHGLQASVLVPCDDSVSLAQVQADLASVTDIQWCNGAADFDAMTDEQGPHRRWLDTHNYGVRGLVCGVDASWLPDWAAFRRMGQQAPLVHQINIAHRPPDIDEQRLLRKHLARLDLMSEGSDWPECRLQAQRRLVERRLASPWLTDELIACDSDARFQSVMAGLHVRLLEQGGVALAESVIQPGRFDELMLTGLDCGHFVQQEAMANVSRSIATATLWAALEQCDPGDAARDKVFDAFISHSTADVAWAYKVCTQLEDAGRRCWIAPRDIVAGHHYAEAIDDALRQSRAIVLLMSVAGMASPHVLRELERAVHHGARVLPVRLEDIEPPHAFSYLLSGSQWTDALTGTDASTVAQRLLKGFAAAQ
jgi:hypothetical protein